MLGHPAEVLQRSAAGADRRRRGSDRSRHRRGGGRVRPTTHRAVGQHPGLSDADLARQVSVPPWKLRTLRAQLRLMKPAQLRAGGDAARRPRCPGEGWLREGEQPDAAQKLHALEAGSHRPVCGVIIPAVLARVGHGPVLRFPGDGDVPVRRRGVRTAAPACCQADTASGAGCPNVLSSPPDQRDAGARRPRQGDIELRRPVVGHLRHVHVDRPRPQNRLLRLRLVDVAEEGRARVQVVSSRLTLALLGTDPAWMTRSGQITVSRMSPPRHGCGRRHADRHPAEQSLCLFVLLDRLPPRADPDLCLGRVNTPPGRPTWSAWKWLRTSRSTRSIPSRSGAGVGRLGIGAGVHNNHAPTRSGRQGIPCPTSHATIHQSRGGQPSAKAIVRLTSATSPAATTTT